MSQKTDISFPAELLAALENLQKKELPFARGALDSAIIGMSGLRRAEPSYCYTLAELFPVAYLCARLRLYLSFVHDCILTSVNMQICDFISRYFTQIYAYFESVKSPYLEDLWVLTPSLGSEFILIQALHADNRIDSSLVDIFICTTMNILSRHFARISTELRPSRG